VRLKIIELVEGLVKLEIDAVDAALLDHDIFTALLQLFLEYHSNNFLHKVVENVVVHILDGTNSDLADSVRFPPPVEPVELSLTFTFFELV